MPSSQRRRAVLACKPGNREPVRGVNDAISQLRYSASFNEYVCECGRTKCRGVVRLTQDEYEELRSNRNQFVVVTGHAWSREERVVRRTAEYQIVERLEAPDPGQDTDRDRPGRGPTETEREHGSPDDAGMNDGQVPEPSRPPAQPDEQG